MRLPCYAPVLLALTVTATAYAAPANEASALKRFEDGKHAFETAHYAEALAAFQDSLQLQPSPNTRLYVGRCFKALGKPASAFIAYRLASREASDRLNATGEKRYKATREAAISESAEIEARVPRMTVAVPSDAPEGTVVILDDVVLPKPAWGIAVEADPGEHTIAATGPRRQPFAMRVKLGEGDQTRVEVKMPKLPTGTLALVLKSRPAGMEITVDGAPLDAADWQRLSEVDAGEHHVVARAPGHVDFAWDGTIADGDRAEVTIALHAAQLGGLGTPRWLFFSVAGLAVGAAGVGTYFAVTAKSHANAETAKDPLLRDPGERDKLRNWSTDANILFIAGSALAVGGTVLFFTTDWKGAPSREAPVARVSPWLAPGTGGFLTTGRF